jgi:hypothetical protein
MVSGPTRLISDGFGSHIRKRLARMAIGRHIAMVVGFGVRRMDGRGSVTSRGVGRRITMGVGFITGTGGRGCRGVGTTGTEVGGGRRSLRLCH